MTEEESSVRGSEGEFFGLEKSPLTPTGVGVASAKDMLLVTFYFIPPEAMHRRYILARLLLTQEMADTLSKAFQEITTKMKEPKTP